MSPRVKRDRPTDASRRRFVALAGAGLAAISAARPALAASAPAKSAAKAKKPAAADSTDAATAAAAAPSAHQKEFERQRTGTLAGVKTIRAYPLPPGGDLPVVFKPMRTPRKEH